MKSSEEQESYRRYKRLLLAAFLICVLIGAAFSGYYAFNTWIPGLLTRKAADLASKGDYDRASFAARRALQINPGDVAANKLMADMAESVGSQFALLWRRRALEVSPESLDARLRLADAAVRSGNFKLASDTLALASADGLSRADFQATAGAAAAGLGDHAAAAQHYHQAVALAPSERSYQIALGAAQLASDDLATQAAGQAILESISADADHGASALRSLSRRFSERGQLGEALRYSDRLQGARGCSFSDSLARLELVRRTRRADFNDALKKIQDEALPEPQNAGSLLFWMTRSGLAQQAIEWARSAVPDLATLKECRPALAACYLTTKDWPRLLELTSSESSWPRFDYMRSAFRARACMETGNRKAAANEWNTAIKAAVKSREALTWLAQTATHWGWKTETNEVLWAAAEERETSKWAVDSLYRHYLAEGDTLHLQRVTKKLVELEPQNDAARNNFALLSLLLANDEYAARTAHELYRRAPKNPAYVSTHAFALFRNGSMREALGVMEELENDDLQKPAIAAYYGVFLASIGARDEALKFLALGGAADLLPEEKALVEEAKRRLAARPLSF